MVATRESFPLLAELLADQQRLATPAARFADAHESGTIHDTTSRFRDLIPLTAPKAGEQYAFEVDLDACTGCKACVAACHALNGLDECETWRDVGMLVGTVSSRPFQQTVTTACHHCEDPACLNGCPVLAYEKDPVTGIVRHLDDQCIGCQYCVLKCPYDVPKYNARLGIVRKCDMCHGRLAHGEAPACAQACPTQAIRIVTVSVSPDAEVAANMSESAAAYESTSDVARDSRPSTSGTIASAPNPGSSPPLRNSLGATAVQLLRQPAGVDEKSVTHCVTLSKAKPAGRGFLPGAPAADYTRPTTRYVSRRDLPLTLQAGDAFALRPQPAHAPLVIMLTLLPLAVGCQVLASVLQPHASFTHYVKLTALFPTTPTIESVTHCVTLLGAVAGVLGIAASAAHLGQPLRAWRVFLGWRRSWLSREAMVFGGWLPLAVVATLVPGLRPVAAFVGLVGLWCSTMIYADTRRRYWRWMRSGPKLLGSVSLFAAAGAIAAGGDSGAAVIVLMASVLAKLAADARVMRELDSAEPETPSTGLLASARLLQGPLRVAWGLRVAIAISAGLLLPLWLWSTETSAEARGLWFGLLLVGELLERTLFFRAVDAPKMPGLAA